MKNASASAVCAALLAGLAGAGSLAAQPQVTVRQAPSAAPAQVPATPADQAQTSPERFTRARDNLVMLRDGRRAVSELSPEELQDVLDLDRMLRSAADEPPSARKPPSFRQQCVDDEVRRAGGNPSRLAWQVIRLKCR